MVVEAAVVEFFLTHPLNFRLHVFLFPHNHKLTSENVVEVKAILTWALTGSYLSRKGTAHRPNLLADELTSLTSPSQYSADKLKQFISLVDEVKGTCTLYLW